ncbi:response regulator transcription factor [Streptomyces sp. NPDC057910]|uniref:response regulator n=1 Tax=Streptomyces sp. NPDC057910 TaxID=3346278 RepID=UPI0036E23CF4
MSTRPDTRISVVIAEDHLIYRQSVVRALERSRCIRVLAEASDGRAAWDAIRELKPDVAVLDYRMPLMDGTHVARLASFTSDIATRVLILSAFTESSSVYKAVEDGAAGFLNKEVEPSHLVDAVVACAAGNTVLPADFAPGLLREIRKRSHKPLVANVPFGLDCDR